MPPSIVENRVENPPATRDPETKTTAAGTPFSIETGKHIEFCQYDAKQLRVIDFSMRALDGREVHFRDLDSDAVVLAFCGTWKPQSMEVAPQLNALQERYKDHVRVVGIDYEEGSAEERAKIVAAAVQKLGIRYPMLLAGLEGPCPVQRALNISVLPTFVVLNRDGRILWREQAAGEATLMRLDRAVANAIRQSGGAAQ